jgi:hypothetical protein
LFAGVTLSTTTGGSVVVVVVAMVVVVAVVVVVVVAMVVVVVPDVLVCCAAAAPTALGSASPRAALPLRDDEGPEAPRPAAIASAKTASHVFRTGA